MGNLPPELVRNSQGQRMSAWNQGRPDLYSQSSFPPPPPGGAGGITQQPPFRYPLSEYLPQGTALFYFRFFFQFSYFFEHKRQFEDKKYTNSIHNFIFLMSSIHLLNTKLLFLLGLVQDEIKFK